MSDLLSDMDKEIIKDIGLIGGIIGLAITITKGCLDIADKSLNLYNKSRSNDNCR